MRMVEHWWPMRRSSPDVPQVSLGRVAAGKSTAFFTVGTDKVEVETALDAKVNNTEEREAFLANLTGTARKRAAVR